MGIFLYKGILFVDFMSENVLMVNVLIFLNTGTNNSPYGNAQILFKMLINVLMNIF